VTSVTAEALKGATGLLRAPASDERRHERRDRLFEESQVFSSSTDKEGMKIEPSDSLSRALIPWTLSALLLAGSLQAAFADEANGVRAAGNPALVADTATPQSTPTASQAPASTRSHEDFVEARIQDLHQKLKITGAQESQWNAFTEVMRDNAQSVDAVLKERSENLHAMTAVDDLRSYQKLADAHSDGLRKLVPAFEALYNTMSDDQKKTADMVFADHEKRPQHASSK
jgi:hypothetical protein